MEEYLHRSSLRIGCRVIYDILVVVLTERVEMETELDKNTFTRLYIKRGMSLRKIAKMYGRSYMFAYLRKEKYGILTRPTKKGISKQILQMLCIEQGLPTEKVAKQLSCSPATVHRKCQEYGIHLKRQRVRRISKTLLEKLYMEEGRSIREVADELSCSYETIRKQFNHYGIPKRNAGTKKIDIDETILWNLYVKEGKSVPEIAKVFNCSVGPIYRKIKRMDLGKE